MIRVIVELVPFGDEALKKKIGELILANLGRRTLNEHNYAAVWDDDSTGIHCSYATHVRANGVWVLLEKLLGAKEADLDDKIFQRLMEKFEK